MLGLKSFCSAAITLAGGAGLSHVARQLGLKVLPVLMPGMMTVRVMAELI